MLFLFQYTCLFVNLSGNLLFNITTPHLNKALETS